MVSAREEDRWWRRPAGRKGKSYRMDSKSSIIILKVYSVVFTIMLCNLILVFFFYQYVNFFFSFIFLVSVLIRSLQVCFDYCSCVIRKVRWIPDQIIIRNTEVERRKKRKQKVRKKKRRKINDSITAKWRRTKIERFK